MLMKFHGAQGKSGSFNPKFYSVSKRSVYTVRADGTLYLNFGWLDDNEDTLRWKSRFLQKLKEKEWLATRIPQSAESKYISVPIDIWAPHVHEFITILKENIRENG